MCKTVYEFKTSRGCVSLSVVLPPLLIIYMILKGMSLSVVLPPLLTIYMILN